MVSIMDKQIVSTYLVESGRNLNVKEWSEIVDKENTRFTYSIDTKHSNLEIVGCYFCIRIAVIICLEIKQTELIVIGQSRVEFFTLDDFELFGFPVS